MKNILLEKKRKKGSAKINATVYAIIGIVLVVVLLTAVAPTAFSGSNNITGAPTFFTTIYPLMIAMAFILLIWRATTVGSK